MNAVLQQGFYGKLPVLGDFVTRRLPNAFVTVWDQWLQSAIAASREQLGELWLDTYLFSPIWRFGLSPGICGENAWAGILMPSVDKVNRHYPLTMAFSVADAEILAYLFGTKEGALWFDELEELALSCLDGLGVDAIDERLQSIHMPCFSPACPAVTVPATSGATKGKSAFHVSTQNFEQSPSIFMELSASLLNRYIPLHSLWSPLRSDNITPALLVCDGLPPIDTYVALLTGEWAQRGWALQSCAVRVLTEKSEIRTGTQTGTKIRDSGKIIPFFELEVTTRPRKARAFWRWRSWGFSVVGMRRKLNEDAMIDRSEIGLWAVADGMGGHQAGDVASQSIVDALSSVKFTVNLNEFASRVDKSLQEVNSGLCRLAAESGEENQIIGSTVVVLLAEGKQCIFLWAGDSRLYRFRDGKLEQLTQDHSLYDDFVREGLVGPGNLAESGRCNIITRAVGASESLLLSRGECQVQDGDAFLLCSDGLDKELTREEIELVFSENPKGEVARILIEQAEKRGARDNVTVVVAEASCTESGMP
ncbi:MAG: type VI secretion system-associated protein TagF [Candidatus Methylumidiphilus sp.]